LVSTLNRLIRHAKKVIVSDALINDGTFELLKHRPPEQNTVYNKRVQEIPKCAGGAA
jgi:hypothetical protein